MGMMILMENLLAETKKKQTIKMDFKYCIHLIIDDWKLFFMHGFIVVQPAMYLIPFCS